MRNRGSGFLAAAVILSATPFAQRALAQDTPGPGVQTSGPGRGRPKRPSTPAPRNKEGRITLGPGSGKTGFWGGGGSIVGHGGSSLPTNLLIADVPFQPWAAALYKIRQGAGQKDDPHARCLPPGGPRQFQTPNGFEFLELPELNKIVVVFGGGPRSWRVMYTDGRALPKADEDRIPTYFGYSSGHWEGDTLVVESEGYNEKFWFHRGGLPHTDALHLTERFSRPDYDTLKYEVTVNDPKAYTKPWTGGFTVPWTYSNWDGTPGGEIQEYLCQDNERDWERLR
jgi:hypothetical protein